MFGALAQKFISTVRLISNVRLIQMTDNDTPVLEGVDDVFRFPRRTFGEWYFEAMAEFPADESLRLDVDVLMLKNPVSVFSNREFDVAFAKEIKGTLNNGVMFARNKRFFVDCLHEYQKTSRDNWNDIQVATQAVVDSGRYRVMKLDRRFYNHIPDRPKDFPPGVKLVHFEGHSRKEWMLAG